MKHRHSLLSAQSGQSLAIVALGMVVLLSVAGLVVDVGNAYALQRKVRNAADAAALAGARELASRNLTTNANVLSAARRYAALNYVSSDNLEVWYADVDGNPLQPVNNDGFAPPAEVGGVPVESVLVEARGSVMAYLAHLVGVHSFRAAERSLGRIMCGACSAGDLFPAAVSLDTFAHNGGVPLIGPPYIFWGDPTAPGSFGWLSWNTDPGHTSNTTLVFNIANRHSSGRWHVGDWIPTGPGVMPSHGVSSAIDALIASGENTVTVPVYNAVTGTGEGVHYQVAGFVRLEITGYNFTGKDKYLQGNFVRWVEGDAEGGCADMGVCVVKLRPPMTEARSIAGVVSIWESRLVVPPGGDRFPVDVVNVVDTSGSMNDRWSPGQETRLTTAKRALSEFHDYLMPDVGDRAGLVTFPAISSGEWYSLLCGSAWKNTYYLGQPVLGLTSTVGSLQAAIEALSATGGTALASAVQVGRHTVLPEGAATPGRTPVLIVASDGIPNCTIDGRWTGFSDDGATSLPCNAMAEQHAIEQANIAKQAGIEIYTIAIGDHFDSSVLRAMASEDTDPSRPHFYQADDPAELEEIYRTIARRLFGERPTCTVDEFEATGEGATVSIYKDGSLYATTTASATGSYVFSNVEPGQYVFAVNLQKYGLTYDVLTEVIGGPAASSPITITVGQGTGTYLRDLYVKTSTPLVCP
ncbi:MAG: VWA domain-containing protein [Anaerolineae bacterium]|nr:VWA domain-containing protein [Anaerolineae bacterium]